MNELLYEMLKNDVLKLLKDANDLSNQQLMELIEESMYQISLNHPVSVSLKERLIKRLFHSFRGLDVLQPLIDDQTITEIMVNCYDEIFIEKNGSVTRFLG